MLTLHITLKDYQVSVRANGKESHQSSLVDLSQSEQEWENFLDNPRVYGEKLFNTLFKDLALVEFDALIKQTERTIILVLGSPELDSIAWEYAYHDNAYIVEDFAFVRALPEKERPQANGRLSKSVERVPLLFIPANPLVDLSGEPMRELDIESEWREMTQHIVKSNAPFDLIELRPATPAALQSVMARFQSGMIAHFSGHGAATKDGAFLLFENENGSSNPLEAREFVREVKDQAWIGFLSACQSAVAERTAFGNLARELVKAGVPFALGMQFNLPDPFAPNISGQFYNYLSQGHAVPEATRQARRAVKRENEFYVGMIALYAAHPDEAGKMGWTGSGARTLSSFAAADVSDLPTPSGFIGRQRELMNIGTKLLEKKKPITVTLHGAGGIGKTALLGQALLRFAPSFESTLAIALDPLPSRESVLSRLERFLSLPSPCSNDTKEREKIVRDRLTSKHTLLGLDNFETLIHARDNGSDEEKKTVKSLYAFFKSFAAAGVTLCVTSREKTSLPGETIQEIYGLEDEMGGRLFQNTVSTRRDALDETGLEKISAAVGGHPLALRLLAPIFEEQAGLTLDGFVQKLETFLPKTRDEWTEQERHKSLGACFAFSMDNLPKNDEGDILRIAISRLSVFTAFFVDFTAAPVLENKMFQREQEAQEMRAHASNILHALWERALLERAIIASPVETSYLYRMHPALAFFARERLTDVETVTEIFWNSMNNFGKLTNNQITKSPWMANVFLLSLPDLLIAAKLKNDEDSASMQINLGISLFHTGLYDEALQILGSSIELNKILNNPKGIPLALDILATIELHRGNLQEAMKHSEQALEIYESLGDLQGKSDGLYNLARILLARNELDTAMKLCEQSLEINRRLNGSDDSLSIGHNLLLLGEIKDDMGDLDHAENLFKEALEIVWGKFHELKDRAIILGEMSTVYKKRGDLEKSLELQKEKLDISRDLKDRREEELALNNMAGTMYLMGDIDGAMSVYLKSLAISEGLGNLGGKSHTLNKLAEIFVKQGKLDKAMNSYQQSLDIMEHRKDLKGKSYALREMGYIRRKRGDLEEATNLFQQSIEIDEQLGDLKNKSTTLLMLGRLLVMKKEYRLAISALMESYYLISSINDSESADLKSKTEETIAHIRQRIGVKKFDDGWHAEFGEKPLPDWLTQQSQQQQGTTVEQFFAGAIRSAREKRPEAEQYFKKAQRMAIDSNAPAELQELGKVLQRIMIGEKNIDLSVLTDELRKMVEKALEG